MGLGAPRIIYGVHSITPYRLSDRTPYGLLKVIGGGNLDLSADQELLHAGSNRFPWAAEGKLIKTGLQAKVKAYPDFAFELFLGATVTSNGVDATGTVGAPANVLGTSVSSATTGFASVAVLTASKANLKFGKYVVKAVSATTFNLYNYSDIDFGNGTAETYLDDSLKVTGSPFTLANGATLDIAALGLEFTGGSAVAMVTGDTAYFSVQEASSASTVIVIGSSATQFPNFGAMLYAQKRATKEMFEIEAHNVIGTGLPIGLAEMKFSEADLKMTCLYSAANDRVLTITHIQPS